MTVQLFRIDDRLIHGQVVIGWANHLKTNRIVLCDEEIQSNGWEKELYLSCVPNNLKAVIYGLDDTLDYLSNNKSSDDKTIVLVKGPEVARKLLDRGYTPENINIGGIHFADSRHKYLSYLYLNESEVSDLEYIMEKGIKIYCQDIPTGKKYNLGELLNK